MLVIQYEAGQQGKGINAAEMNIETVIASTSQLATVAEQAANDSNDPIFQVLELGTRQGLLGVGRVIQGTVLMC